MIISFKEKQIQIKTHTALTGLEISKKYFPDSDILCMACNNELQSLNNKIDQDVETCIFYDIKDQAGARCLATSTTALMLMAAEGIFKNTRISVEHSYGKGFYCEAVQPETLSDNYLQELEDKMEDYISKDHVFTEVCIKLEDLKKINFKRFDVLKNSPKKCFPIYELDTFYHWFISPLVPSAAYIKQFRLTPYKSGFVLEFPIKSSPKEILEFTPSPNLFTVIRESELRGNMLGIRHVDDLNKKALAGLEAEAIQLYEALHEKKIAEIADVIMQGEGLRFVFIAGPSSSGKTTFMKRLSLQLRINGLKPQHLSLDDYFVERHQTPLDKNGELDFEHFDAIDHQLLNEHLVALMNGKGVHLPRFNFKDGCKELSETLTYLKDDEILILEGIHGLNPELAAPIPEDTKFRIYISALTQLNYNLYNRVSTSDTRLLRRMYRDFQFRNHSLEKTLLRWPSVRSGENKWIFPFQENADIYFNSALEYEWSVFSGILLDMLSKIPNDSPVKVESERLCRLMELFVPFESKFIPPTSLLQEFLGGSSFVY